MNTQPLVLARECFALLLFPMQFFSSKHCSIPMAPTAKPIFVYIDYHRVLDTEYTRPLSPLEASPKNSSSQRDTDASNENDTGGRIAQSIPETTDQQKIKNDRCANPLCHERATKTCKGCNKTRYCSKACQRTDWSRHRETCPASSSHNAGCKLKPVLSSTRNGSLDKGMETSSSRDGYAICSCIGI